MRQSDGRHSSPQHINDLDQISGPPVEQLGPDHASFENAQPSDQLFNVVSSFGDMNLAPQMHFPTSLQMLPMQHPAVIPISPAHVAHQRHPHQVLHQTPATYYLWVPQERVGAVIGGHGAVIRNLQDRSGATIQVHNETIRDEHKLFTIFGTYAQYEAAANLITDIVERPRPSARGGPSVSSDKSQYPNLHDHTPRATEMYKTVYVPTTCVGLVIGRNGETIRSLQDKSGADIKVTPDEDAQPGSEHRSITISGTEEAIATAHQLVSEIVNDAKSLRPPHMGIPAGSSPNGEPVITEVLPVPNDKVGLIIGKRGTTIRDLQMRSGAKIQVTKDDTCVQSDGSRPVTITGIRSNVDEAKTLIATKINIPLPPSSPVPTAFSATTPGGTPVLPHATPTQPHPYMFSQAFDPEFLQSNQQSFQPGFEMSENPVSNRGGVAYYPYFGYNSYAAIAQQRHFQQAVQMHYGHGQQPLQDPQVSQQPHPEQQEFHLPPAFEAAGMPQSHSVDGSGGPSGMVPRSGSGNIVMYPTHPFQQVSHHMPSPQHYPPNPNQRIYPPRDPSQIAHANMHSQMYSQGQQGRVHTNAQILQAQGQTHAQIDAKGQPQLHAQIHAEGHVEAHPSSPPQERTHHEPEQPKG